MRRFWSIFLFILSFSIFGVRIYHNTVFKQHVSGHLKRAADANTIELADEELRIAIAYLEEHEMTDEYTSIFVKTPDEDINFWYRNLKASREELQKLKGSENALEKTNVLLKLRETLTDTGEKTRVTVPKGLSVYPHNKLWTGLMFTACASFITSGGLLMAVAVEEEKKRQANNTNQS